MTRQKGPGVETIVLALLAGAFQISSTLPVGGNLVRIAVADLVLPFLLCLVLWRWVVTPWTRPEWRVRALVWWLAAISLWLLVSVLIGRSTMGAWSAWAVVNKFAGWFVLLAYLLAGAYFGQMSTPAHVRSFLRGLFAFGTVISLWTILLYVHSQAFDPAIYPRMQGLMDNPNAFGYLMAVIVVVALPWMAREPLFGRRRDAFLMGLFISVVIYSGSRSAMVGLGSAILLLAALGVLDKRLILRILVAAGILVPLIYGVPEIAKALPEEVVAAAQSSLSSSSGWTTDMGRPPPYYLRPSIVTDSGIAHRFRIMQDAFDSWRASPVWGVGLGAFLWADIARYGQTGATIHNTALWLLTETGLVGLGLFAAFLVVCARALFRDHGKGRLDPLAVGALGAVAVFLGASVGMEAMYQRHLWFLAGYALVIPAVQSRPARRLLFVVTVDWYFVSHRLHLARAAMAAGYRVALATRVTTFGDRLRAEGIEVIPLKLSRRLGNPLAEALALTRIFRRWKPSIVHNVALKPAVIGSLAAQAAGVPHVVNAVSGLGWTFIGRSAKATVMRAVARPVLRFVLGRAHARLVVQNRDDVDFFRDRLAIPLSRIALIRGAGVDVEALTPMPEPEGPVRAAFVGRLLWDKGVGELVEAARLLKDRGSDARIVLVGRPDPENPRSIPEAMVREWVEKGLVEWWGHRDDIGAVWREAHVAVLPSYREGLPKALLEAAACARPLVTTDVPGCREVVEDGLNGLLVPVRDPLALAAALDRLASDFALRARMGAESRKRAGAEFSDRAVACQTLAVYESCLGADAVAALSET